MPSNLKKIRGKINLPHKKKKNNFLKYFFATLFILLSCSAGIIAGVLTSSLQTIQAFNNVSDTPMTLENFGQMFIPLDKKINVLVMGQDHVYYRGKKLEDTNEFGRSDSMMLVGIDPIKRKVNVLSIPRDSRVIIHGHQYYDKINAALAYGGPDLAVNTVKDLTGVPIDYYIVLKLGGVPKLIDALGGVDVYVEEDMYYVDETAHLGINIHKGWHRMNGEQAHQYIRFRKDALGDIGRVQRQQKFLRALMDKVLSPETFFKLPQLLEIAKQNIVTNLPPVEMVKIANFAKTISKEDIKMVMLPGEFGGYSGYWIINEKLKNEVIADLFPESTLNDNNLNSSDSVSSPQEKYKLTVLNGTEVPHLAKKAANELQKLGWRVISIQKAKALYKKTQIISQHGKSDAISAISSDLGINAEPVLASIGDIYTDFTVIVGEDYANLVKQKELTQKKN